MRISYQVIAWIICGLVMLQAATHAWFSAGAAKYIEGGGTLDLSATGAPPFPEVWGVIIHGMSGMYLIPLVAVVLLVTGYFSHVPGALVYAVVVVVLVAVQVTLGLSAPALPFLAFLHGMNALLIFGTALLAIHQVRTHESSHSRERVGAGSNA
ncbi:hypothetical protein [Corynebacterium sp. A21]|uniref:hypothetical protein n=1 Tax=Corynebacterium sp. A21 TaxID=3457318 RepID=UPI003FD26320